MLPSHYKYQNWWQLKLLPSVIKVHFEFFPYPLYLELPCHFPHFLLSLTSKGTYLDKHQRVIGGAIFWRVPWQWHTIMLNHGVLATYRNNAELCLHPQESWRWATIHRCLITTCLDSTLWTKAISLSLYVLVMAVRRSSIMYTILYITCTVYVYVYIQYMYKYVYVYYKSITSKRNLINIRKIERLKKPQTRPCCKLCLLVFLIGH